MRRPGYALSALIAALLAALPFAGVALLDSGAEGALGRLHWPFAEARVSERTALERPCLRERETPAYRYVFAFEIAGAPRTAETVLFARDCAAYAPGETVQLRYDPADPARVVTRMQAGYPFGFTWPRVALAFLMLFGLFFAFAHVIRRDAFRR